MALQITDVVAGYTSEVPILNGVSLSADNFKQLYVPPGYAHGFCVVSEFAQIEYKCTDFYDPADEGGVMWNDPLLAIDWPTRGPKLSERDRSHAWLK